MSITRCGKSFPGLPLCVSLREFHILQIGCRQNWYCLWGRRGRYWTGDIPLRLVKVR